jgi:hypothetical protein
MISAVITSSHPGAILTMFGGFGSTGALYSFTFGSEGVRNDSYSCTVTSWLLRAEFGTTVSVPVVGYPVSTAGDWPLFNQLADEWRKERGITSSATKMAMCPAYQQIIGMGISVVPFILRELKNKDNDPEHWFWALEMITREDPVPISSYGNTVEMARAWVSWGENQNGLAVGDQVSFHH